MVDKNTSRAFWVRAPGEGELREAPLAAPSAGEVCVRTRFSAISRGTETLVFRGEVPPSLADTMRAPFQEGEFPGPVKYGYIAVGDVEAGGPGVDPALVGRTVFCLHPHQDRFVVPASAVTPLPADVPAGRAVLAANLETAINAVWDSGASVGDRIAVVGGGVVGLLVGWLCARMPGTRVDLIDPEPSREAVARALGMTWHADGDAPELTAGSFDLAFHASGNPDGAAAALSLLGAEATLVELSWYGTRPVPLPLGGPFHPRRLRIVGSQVGSLPPSRMPRWTFGRRLEVALALLADPVLDRLISGESSFDALAETMAALASPGADRGTLCHRIRYADADVAPRA